MTHADDEAQEPTKMSRAMGVTRTGDAVIRGRDAFRDTRALGVRLDLRRPAVARTKFRLYNPNETRRLPPKVFRVGRTINLCWIVHTLAYFPNCRKARQCP